ncbi:T9SS type A sorting domain-containing protein, partial [Flavobacteriales bacterium]|nr:T9SS type A sorting domain-containing protein [Flavobacteriales bacterium]
STCDIDNGETVEYTCADDNGNGVNDVLDFTEIPLACAPAYIENCDSEVALTMTADTMGYVPTGDIANYCMPSTVEELANGETCDDRAPEAIRLFNFSGGESYTLVEGGSSIVEVMQDSSMHIVLEVENADGDAGFVFDAIYDGAHDWNEWLALPGLHNYKKDCAEIFPGIEIWTEWLYYIMDGGTMSGTGRFAGSEFALQHQPLNAYYGLQIGEGANNKNENYGASAWFFWTGEYVLDGASQGAMASSGDIFMDLDCCLGWQIDYSYNVVDDCGNSNGFNYTDLGTGNFGSSANSTVSGGHTPVDITAGTSSLKDPIRITGLSPNPTSDISTLGFVVSNNMRLRIDLYTMGGGYVAELFDGNASEEVQYVLDIDASTLSSGMYQIRMSSNDYVLVKKLLVSE